METYLHNLQLQLERALPTLSKVALIIFGALAVARLVRAALGTALGVRLMPQQLVLLRSVVGYAVYGLAVVLVLEQLGFDPKVLLGAAGFLTVAIGFASQTSVSNLISGLFLIFERPFIIGDAVTIDGVTGEVMSIDLLSIKLRTFDNLYVRVPNEAVLKTKVTTLTRFPIRRVELQVGVAYRSNLEKVRAVLLQIANDHPQVLREPEPMFLVTGFGPSSVNLSFLVWVERDPLLKVRAELYTLIHRSFSEAGIEIPFPQMTLSAAPDSQPLPVKLA
ncbi:MAG: mechanosensitive ion channel family protein [Deltaproteobacteria bacterium]|nr:mechanosensitive ion channel family protein [Deltaproteobacteria bacterium]